MFEITYNDRDTLATFVEAKKAYRDASYDFTFENRFIIYHSEFTHALHYIALDTRTGYGSEICVKPVSRPIEPCQHRAMTPMILNAITYSGDKRRYDPMIERPMEVIDTIFRIVLPAYGYTVREEQINLSKRMYKGLTRKLVTVAEAEVGTGKTLAYMIAALVAKHNNKLLHAPIRPITITTSNIELQKALVEKEIPKLSKMLMDYHLIKRPLTAVLRKGKEHYFCRFRYEDLLQKLRQHPDKHGELIAAFEKSHIADRALDLDAVSMSAGLKSKICVKRSCRSCPFANECRYRMFLDDASEYGTFDFQITNYNLYLAAMTMADEEVPRLLLSSDFTIVDEAHKFKECAETMFGETIRHSDIIRYVTRVKHLCATEDKSAYKRVLSLLASESDAFFRQLASHHNEEDRDAEHGTRIELTDAEQTTVARLIDHIAYLEASRTAIPDGQQKLGKKLIRKLLSFQESDAIHTWVETDENGVLFLCNVPKDIGGLLHKIVWDKFTSHLLTSGTISDGVSFDYFAYENGIARLGRHLLSFSSTASPFNYENHARLYIPEDMPYPDNNDPGYIQAVADQVVQLVKATNGHTAILFTSYKVLHAVYELTKEQFGKYTVICMTRGNKKAISQFKQCENGVLFASGSMWEGVDCIGDCLSSVIIPRLPFPLRSASMEYKREVCCDLTTFVRDFAVPEMIIKLRQGVGRLIRCETDTGLVSILDSRATDRYSAQVDKVMRKYPRVSNMEEIEAFFRSVKDASYFRGGEAE